MRQFVNRFLGIFAGLIVLAAFMVTTSVISHNQPQAPPRVTLAIHLDRAVSPAMPLPQLSAPHGLSEVPWKVGAHTYPHISWGSVSGAKVYELRTTRFDRILSVRNATVYLGPGTYSAQVRAGRSAHDVHGKWSVILRFTVHIPMPSGSTREVRAMNWALTRIGDPYVWAAAGPSAFDCSGLVLWSYQQTGKALPHSAAMQYGYGFHVSRSGLSPGDLVFFYAGIGHVGIYVGGGKMVDAPHRGALVRIDTIDWANYVGATRIT